MLERLSWQMTTRGARPTCAGTTGEFTAKSVRAWLGMVGVKTRNIDPGSSWENCYAESLNAKIYYTGAGTRVLTRAGASTTTACARTARSATTRQHRRRSPLDRPPLRTGPCSDDFRIG